MKNKQISQFIFIILFLGIAVWIFLNPVVATSCDRVQEFTTLLNRFFEFCHLKYNFSEKDTISLIRFLEYFILGLCGTVVFCVRNLKNAVKNIPLILCIGIMIAMFEANFRALEIRVVLYSFICLSVGLIFCMALMSLKSTSQNVKNSKYKAKKYDRRR